MFIKKTVFFCNVSVTHFRLVDKNTEGKFLCVKKKKIDLENIMVCLCLYSTSGKSLVKTLKASLFVA